MKDKLLVWIGGTFFHFGIAKFIQEKSDYDLYSIIDANYEDKQFFEKQQLVNFNKVWYYRDHVSVDKHRKPDMNYLKNIEKKYRINLWMIAYSERSFYKFNDYYKFSGDQILSILEQECRLFEKVLDEINPDFFLVGATDSHHNYLLSEICKARNVNVIMFGGSRLGYREMLARETDRINEMIEPTKPESKNKIDTFEELRNYLQKNYTVNQFSKAKKKLKLSPSRKLKKFIKMILVYGGKKYQNQFQRVGMTRSNILFLIPIMTLRRYNSKKFVNKNFKRDLDSETHFVYYPLQSEPERALSIASPFYTNQIEVITHIAKSLPVGYKLLVKEHPLMELKGGRSVSFYKELMKLPNVQLMHSSIKQEEFYKKCSLVITISGTAAFECGFYGKPSIVFAETLFSHLSFVHQLQSLEELPTALRSSLQKKVNPTEIGEFIDLIENNSIQFDRAFIASDIRVRFLHRKIEDNEMESFMEDYRSEFESLASYHISKIEQIKKRKLKDQHKEELISKKE